MREINIVVKQVGVKRPIYNSLKIEIDENILTLKDFLSEVVKNQVKEFNEKRLKNNFISFLTSKEINEKASKGKVSFGESYDKTLANYEKALETALLAFTDGMFKVFVDDEIFENLDDKIVLKENSEVIFIKLTFLAGRSY